jgi:acetyltransferase-like isoleucine patch superfamily enzyme
MSTAIQPSVGSAAPIPRVPRAELPAALADSGAVVYARRLSIGADVHFGRGVHLVGDEVSIGAGTRLGDGCDLRAGTLSLGAGAEFAPRVRVLCADRFDIGPAARISADVEIVCREFTAGNLLFVGNSTVVGYGGTMESTAVVRLGHRVALGPFNIVNANHPVELGDDVGSGSHVALFTHGYHFGHRILDGYQAVYRPVRLARRVWLGYHCTILPGVSIGEETIVAAGAVVTRSAGDRRLLAGVPAREKEFPPRVAPSADDAEALVLEVLRRWCAELIWKGGAVTAHPDGHAWTVSADGIAAVVRLVDGRAPADEPARRILVHATAAGDRVAGDDRTTVFDLPAGSVHGPRDSLVEDLRDHLRRNTMPCGDDSCFRSIVPEGFARLLAAGPERHA